MLKVLLAIVAFASLADAQIEGNPANWCREGFFTRDSDKFTIATVKGGRNVKAYFFNDDKDNCPVSANCQRKAYVVGGDAVVVNRSSGEYSCAWYTPRSGRPTIGWIRLSELRFVQPCPIPATRHWLGEWTYGENGIDLTENKLAENLNVTGSATWIGANPGNVHVGGTRRPIRAPKRSH
jgi:hypothetical protein